MRPLFFRIAFCVAMLVSANSALAQFDYEFVENSSGDVLATLSLTTLDSLFGGGFASFELSEAGVERFQFVSDVSFDEAFFTNAASLVEIDDVLFAGSEAGELPTSLFFDSFDIPAIDVGFLLSSHLDLFWIYRPVLPLSS